TRFSRDWSSDVCSSDLITIAISTVISAFNSLTLSPALAAVLLQPHHAKTDIVSRIMDRLFGWVFRPFNRAFTWAGDKYGAAVAGDRKGVGQGRRGGPAG